MFSLLQSCREQIQPEYRTVTFRILYGNIFEYVCYLIYSLPPLVRQQRTRSHSLCEHYQWVKVGSEDSAKSIYRLSFSTSANSTSTQSHTHTRISLERSCCSHQCSSLNSSTTHTDIRFRTLFGILLFDIQIVFVHGTIHTFEQCQCDRNKYAVFAISPHFVHISMFTVVNFVTSLVEVKITSFFHYVCTKNDTQKAADASSTSHSWSRAL